MQPLAASGDTRNKANTNLSTTISLTLIDADGHEIPVSATVDQPIELIIPRDPDIVISSFTLQNASSNELQNQTFNFYFVNISRTNNLTVSVHLEIHPLNQSKAYWLVYRFDGKPQVNSSVRLFDGWTLFCPSSNALPLLSTISQSSFSPQI